MSAAVEHSRRKANMVAQEDGKFGPWGWPQDSSKPIGFQRLLNNRRCYNTSVKNSYCSIISLRPQYCWNSFVRKRYYCWKLVQEGAIGPTRVLSRRVIYFGEHFLARAIVQMPDQTFLNCRSSPKMYYKLVIKKSNWASDVLKSLVGISVLRAI